MVLQPDKSIEMIRGELLAGANGLAASARRVIRLRAVLLWVSVGLMVLLLILLSDILLRREEFGLRVLSLLAWIGVAIFSADKLIRPAWRFAPTSLQVARWIEKGRPELGEQLSTAVELAGLPPSDNRYGSNGFRDSALRAWSTSRIELDWQRHLDTSGLRQAAAGLIAVSVAAVLLVVVWPAESRTAFARLTMPWSVYHWPQHDSLQLKDPPHVVALGSEVQIEIFDARPPLPEKVGLQIRPMAAADDGERRLTASLDTVQVSDLAIANVPAITTAIEVRAVGGDDDSMPWHRIAVVRPPELEKYQFIIHPPSYTGLPSTTLVGRRISLLAGSRVEFRGEFNEPLSQAKVLLLDQSPETTNVSQGDSATIQQAAWTPKLAEDGRSLHIAGPDGQPLSANRPIHWQFAVVTRDSLELLQPERWSIEVTADAHPLIELQPAELAELTSNADLPLRGRASDDQGIAQIVACMKIEDAENSESATRTIWSATSANESTAGPRELQIDAAWELTSASPLVAGQQVTIWLEARDIAGQVGRSQPQSFTIRKADELLASVQEKQKQLLERVRELVDTQRRNSQLFDRNWAVAQQANRIQREQLDVLRNVAQVQRAIAEQLDGEKSSLWSAVDALHKLLDQNQLADTEFSAELSFLQNSIAQLAQNSMKSATDATEATANRAQATLAEEKSIDSALASVAQNASESQVGALQSLESLLDRLTRSEALQQVQYELSQILNQQNTLRHETDQLQLQRLEGSSNQEALRELKTAIVADQHGLARRLDDLVQRAKELGGKTSEDQETLRSQMERLSSELTEAQASGKMRRATDEIREDRYSAAAATQQQVTDLLKQTLNEIGSANRSQLSGLQGRADDLRRTAKQLIELADAQARLAEQIDAPKAASQQNSLARQQADLREGTRKESQRAEQKGDSRLANELNEAAIAQQRSEESVAQGDFAKAAQAATEAARQLAQSAQQLQKRAEQLDKDVLEQQMFQLATALSELTEQQRPIVDELASMVEAQTATDRKEQQAEIRQLAVQQEAVRMLLRDVRAQTAELATFDWTLAQAEDSMSRTVAAAQRYRIEPDANNAAQNALRMLELASAALQNPGSATSTNQTDSQAHNERQEGQDGRSNRPVPFIASLKLLRSLQQEISDETGRAETAPDREQRLRELSTMQQSLAAQIEQLLREFSSDTKAGKNE